MPDDWEDYDTPADEEPIAAGEAEENLPSEAEVDAATEIVSAEMVGAIALDPPLAVDAGAGPNWLAAK